MISFKVVFFILSANYVNGANILGVFPLPAISHYILASKLMKGLAEAGHNVTIISPYELTDLPKNGRYTDVVLDGFKEDFETMRKTMNLFEMELQSPLKKIKMMGSVFLDSTNKTLHHPNVKKLLQSNEKFDAVIMEQFANDALKVFADIYKCPIIILCSVGPNAWVNPSVGTPQPVASVPHMLNNYFSKDFTFLSRSKNLLFYLMDYFISNWLIQPMQDELMHQAFPDAPPLYDLYTNVSLILLNSHTSMYSAVPIVPNMVEIGGYFIDPPRKLPKDLEDFLDGAKDGVIYFSMGSNLQSKDIPEEKKQAILSVLGKLKQKVLWKFEEDLPEKPSNIMIRKWLPQQDVLAHPNIKLFITHGGLLSTTETIYHGKPILALPVFADQPANAARAEAGGYGLLLNYNDPDFTEERFGSLVNEILSNPKYRENAQKRSEIYHDRPKTPMETAIYWVEYVIRHKGAPHLRVAGIRMPWYKYFMVDVFGTLIVGIYIVLCSIKLVLKKILSKRGKAGKVNKSTKKIKSN